jgi:phosphatidate cytidylyltransferase
LLIFFICGYGTFELVRALKPHLKKHTFILTLIYGILFVPVYTAFDLWIIKGRGWNFALCLTFLFLAVEMFIDAVIKTSTIKELLASILGYIYPAVLLLSALVINSLGEKGFIPLLLLFVIAPCADTMAYLVGMTYQKIRKGQAKKLCPNLSPKKTVAGAIGGLIGGAVGAIIIYFIFTPEVNFFSPVLLFIIAGLVGSFLTEAGDLFESYIKRKVGIKDMGKIMPGHGGVLDRVDGMLFASPLIMLIFLLV